MAVADQMVPSSSRVESVRVEPVGVAERRPLFTDLRQTS
jgi:hypothetical protein